MTMSFISNTDEPRHLNDDEVPGKCTICHYELPYDEVALAGYVGILVVRLCETCFAGLYKVFSSIIEINNQSEE